MAFLIKDRVLETCSSPGTGAATLLGAVTGYQSFSTAFSSTNGTTTYYCIADQGGANWEVGLGTWNTGNTLTRTTVIASSNAGATVNFASGTQNIFCTYPAEYAVYSGGPLGTPSSVTLTNATGLPLTTGVTGTLGTTNGGTGLTSFTANGVVYASSTSALTTGSALTFSGSVLSVSSAATTDLFTWAAGGTAKTGYLYSDSAGVAIGDTAGVAGNNTYYNKTSNYIANYINGSEQMRLNSTGLGIGTSSPTSKLTVSSVGSTIELKQNATGSATYYVMDNTIETGGKRWRFGYTGAAGIPCFSLYNQTDNVTSWVADASGNLGLGVTPSAWRTATKATQIGYAGSLAGSTAANNVYLGANWYINSTPADTYINSGYASLYQQQNGIHYWFNAPSGTAGNAITFTQAMTLDASGNLLAGKTSSGQVLTPGFEYNNTSAQQYLSICNNTAGNTALYVANNATSGTRQFVLFYGGSSAVGSITYNGTVTLYNTTSDQRLKENVVDAGSGLAKLENIKIRAFDWKVNGMHTDFGVIAQEINEVAPEIVSIGTDNEDGTIKNPWQVDTSTLVPAMIKAIQELSAQVTTLQTQVTALKG